VCRRAFQCLSCLVLRLHSSSHTLPSQRPSYESGCGGTGGRLPDGPAGKEPARHFVCGGRVSNNDFFVSFSLHSPHAQPASAHAARPRSMCRADALYRRPVAVTTFCHASKSSASMRPRVRPVGEKAADEAAVAWRGCWKGEVVVAGVVEPGGSALVREGALHVCFSGERV